MPNFRGRIKDFAHGDTLKVTRTIESVGSSIDKAWFTIKKKKSDSDANAIVQKVITAVDADGGIISQVGGESTDAEVLFELTPAETLAMLNDNGLPVWRYYDIKVHALDGDVFTPEIGRIRGQKHVTDAIV